MAGSMIFLMCFFVDHLRRHKPSSINNSEYDYHTLVKVAEMAGLAGLVGFHESEDGYIVSFPDTENTQALINDYKARLRDLENNIWQH